MCQAVEERKGFRCVCARCKAEAALDAKKVMSVLKRQQEATATLRAAGPGKLRWWYEQSAALRVEADALVNIAQDTLDSFITRNWA